MITLKKFVNDPVLWRRLHDERIGLSHAWIDGTNGRYYVYAITPALPDGAYLWDSEFDDRPRLMTNGETAEEALLKLFDDPRRKYAPSLGRSMAACGVELELLAGAYRDRH